jgi:hypothetical protein
MTNEFMARKQKTKAKTVKKIINGPEAWMLHAHFAKFTKSVI